MVGDDIFAKSSQILKGGIDEGIANSILIKVNQFGTLTETLETMRLAASAGYTTVVSHRSGETEDPLIADLVAATCAGLIKTVRPAAPTASLSTTASAHRRAARRRGPIAWQQDVPAMKKVGTVCLRRKRVEH